MDTIKFERTDNSYVNIFINGKILWNCLQEIPSDEGVKNYQSAIKPSRLYRMLAGDLQKNDLFIPGFVRNLSFFMRIAIDEKVVTWQDFIGAEGDLGRIFNDERYTAESPAKFTFNKTQYFSEVEKLHEWILESTAGVEPAEYVEFTSDAVSTIEFRGRGFEFAHFEDDEEIEKPVAEIFINGEKLLARIEKYEDIIGCGGSSHAPLKPAELYENLSEEYKRRKVAIYGCICGVVECYPAYITVSVDENFVYWHNFKFPDKKEAERKRKGFGKIIFDKVQYFQAVKSLRDA